MATPEGASAKPLFTADDSLLVLDAANREFERLQLYGELHGVAIEPDSHIPRLRDLAQRLTVYVRSEVRG